MYNILYIIIEDPSYAIKGKLPCLMDGCLLEEKIDF